MRNKSGVLVIFCLAITVILGLSFVNHVAESTTLRNIASKLTSFYTGYPQQKVHLHTDKTYYHYDEKVFIKAYLLDASTHKPDHSDHTLYIELLNPSGSVVQTKITRMEEGLGRCDFSFRDTIPEGYYKLRAYTNWMRNRSEDFYFTKDIYISNPVFTTYATRDAVSIEKRRQRKSSRQEPDYDVSFHPEGGQFLSNVTNRIAFKAIDEAGEGIEIQGVLKDKKRRTVSTFSSTHLGMGTFTFIPEKGNRYTAEVSTAGMKEKSFALPKLIDTGINISAEHLPGEVRIKVLTNLGPGSYPPNTKYYFIAHLRGEVVFSTEIDLIDQKSLVFDIPKKIIPTGVLHLTLFNYLPAPISERLLFINNNDQLRISAVTNRTDFSKREKASITFTINDPQGNPVQSEFSLSVAEESTSDISSGIVSNLLLSSDLKGFIENPGYYFNQYNDEKEHNLDYLMMTQGWRRFRWTEVLSENKLPVKHPKETGLQISGKITRDFFGIPLRDIKVTMTILNEFNDVYETRTDLKGNYRFSNLNYRDTIMVRIEAEKETGRKNLVILLDEMDQESMEDINYRTNQVIRRGDPKGKWVKKEEPVDDDPFSEENNRINRIHSEPRDVIIVDEHLANYSSVIQILQGRVPGVNVVGNKVIIRGVGTFYGSTDPLFLVDGVAVDPGYALSMPPMDIDRIEVLKGPEASVYGMRGGNGVIAIYTKRGKFMIRGRLDFGMLGYTTPTDFYSPKYEPGKIDPFEDDRQTLFWAPEINTNTNGVAEVSFYTSDIPGTYLITIEGISKEGLPGTSHQSIIVK